MDLRQRTAIREHLDAARHDSKHVQRLHRQLYRLNKLFWFSRPFEIYLPPLLGQEHCKTLRILDVGCGSGQLGTKLTQWAEKRRWQWHFTGMDWSADTLETHSGEHRVAGSATHLPFADLSFDVVLASQMTHHLESEDEIVRHFREAWRVARSAVLISDVRRHWAVAAMVWLGCLAVGTSRELRQDGGTSVRRGFRIHEWQRMAQKAGVADAEVRLYFGTRILLGARKSLA